MTGGWGTFVVGVAVPDGCGLDVSALLTRAPSSPIGALAPAAIGTMSRSVASPDTTRAETASAPLTASTPDDDCVPTAPSCHTAPGCHGRQPAESCKAISTAACGSPDQRRA